MAPTNSISRKSSGSSNTSSHKVPSSSSNVSPWKMALNPVSARKASQKKERPQKSIFKDFTLSIAGTITDTSGAIIPHENIVKWFTAHGGTHEREVSKETTHLICSIEEYKKKGPQVQKAWNCGTHDKQCHIVVFDWLEDSLLGPKGSKRRRVEKGYTLDRTIARIKRGKKDHTAFRARFEEGVRTSKELCDNKLHKVYFDSDGFEYKIMLTRIDLSSDRPKFEKYTLFFFESIAKPHTYMSGAKLSSSHRPISYYREHCHPKDYPNAMRNFKHFFFEKTQIVWDDRLEGIKAPSNAFVYTPPVLGRPVGLLPLGYIRPELRIIEINSDNENSDSGEEGGLKKGEKDDVVYDTDSDVDDSESESPVATGRRGISPASECLQESVYEGYGYQPSIPDRRCSASSSPTMQPRAGY